MYTVQRRFSATRNITLYREQPSCKMQFPVSSQQHTRATERVQMTRAAAAPAACVSTAVFCPRYVNLWHVRFALSLKPTLDKTFVYCQARSHRQIPGASAPVLALSDFIQSIDQVVVKPVNAGLQQSSFRNITTAAGYPIIVLLDDACISKACT